MSYLSERTATLGPIGALIPVWTTGVGLSTDRPTSVVRTLGKAKAFRGRASSREWAVSAEFGSSGEMGGLLWLAEYGNPPFVWYPPDAVFGNVLEPAVAGLVSGRHNGLEGALVEVEPGVWVKSAVPDGGGAVSLPYRGGALDPIPVITGRPVTVSAWLRGASSRIDVAWRDVSGATISSSAGSASSRASLVRVSRTLTPPAGAVQMTLVFFGDQVAGPSVSLTGSMTPYSPGKGCKRAVVHGLSESLAVVTQQESLSGYSFTVSEVG